MHNDSGRTPLALVVLSLVTVLLFAAQTTWAYPVKKQPGRFEPTGSTTQIFELSGPGYCFGSNPQQARLSDGRVLVTDGSYADLYEPKLGEFRATGSPNPPLTGPTVVPLLNGKVLMTGLGNCCFTGDDLNSELYDPATGTFSRTGNMVNPGACTTGVRLQNGKVLMIEGDNGYDGNAPQGDAEIYDPTTGTFSVTGPMTWQSSYPYETGSTATLLNDGRVLVAGGDDNFDCGAGSIGETLIYNPDTGTFANGPGLKTARECHTATLLPNGKVLIAGGYNSPGCDLQGGGLLASAEVYDPATNTISLLKSSMTAARCGATAILLNNGMVLITGGESPPDEDTDPAAVGSAFGLTRSAELFDPNDNTFRDAGDMVYTRAGASSTLLFDSEVLITGGSTVAPTSAELYEKGNGR